MHLFNAKLSNLLNNYAFHELQIGQNDCNILVAEYLDMLFETNFKDQLQSKYSTIPEGLKVSKKLTGFKSVLEACEKYLVPSDTVQTGSVLISKRMIKNKEYYSASIVFDGQGLVEKNQIYTPTDIKDIEFELIFNRG